MYIYAGVAVAHRSCCLPIQRLQILSCSVHLSVRFNLQSTLNSLRDKPVANMSRVQRTGSNSSSGSCKSTSSGSFEDYAPTTLSNYNQKRKSTRKEDSFVMPSQPLSLSRDALERHTRRSSAGKELVRYEAPSQRRDSDSGYHSHSHSHRGPVTDSPKDDDRYTILPKESISQVSYPASSSSEGSRGRGRSSAGSSGGASMYCGPREYDPVRGYYVEERRPSRRT